MGEITTSNLLAVHPVSKFVHVLAAANQQMVLSLNCDPTARQKNPALTLVAQSKNEKQEHQTLEWKRAFQKCALMSTDAPRCETPRKIMNSYPLSSPSVKRTTERDTAVTVGNTLNSTCRPRYWSNRVMN